MRILIVAIGRARGRPATVVYEDYVSRINAWRIELREIEIRKRLPPARLRVAEAEALLAARSTRGVTVALDRDGEVATTAAFARRVQGWQQDGVPELSFFIGGAEGLDADLCAGADWCLAFGRMTWPHLMARAMLAEQLYRVQQILAGHPYHRE